MARRPITHERMGNPQRRRGRVGAFTPESAVDELNLPLPESQERFRRNVLTLLLADDMTRREERALVWGARRDSFRRAITPDPAHPRHVTSPTLERLWASTVEDATLNARNILSERAAIKTAIATRTREVAAIETALRPSATKPEPPVQTNGLPAYQARRLQLAAQQRADAASARRTEAAEELDRLKGELTALHELNERLHLDAILSTLAARYEHRARFYLTRAHLPRELRGRDPKPLTAADLYRVLRSGLDGAWLDVAQREVAGAAQPDEDDEAVTDNDATAVAGSGDTAGRVIEETAEEGRAATTAGNERTEDWFGDPSRTVDAPENPFEPSWHPAAKPRRAPGRRAAA